MRQKVVGTAVLANRTNSPLSSTTELPQKSTRLDNEKAEFKYFKVLYTKFAPHKKRKNKSFEDGFVVLGGQSTCTGGKGKYANKVALLDENAKEKAVVPLSKMEKIIGEALKQYKEAEDVESFILGGYEVELDCEVSAHDFQSGAMFLEPHQNIDNLKDDPLAQKIRLKYKPFAQPPSASSVGGVLKMNAKDSFVSTKQQVSSMKKFTSMFNPNGSDALVLNRGDWEADMDGVSPVVLDPSLCRHLRPHQKEGVQFLYRCMTERVQIHRGCILADDMGLGKSLQAISLLHTMLKQGPYGSPMLQRALIVAPSSLLDNWKQEIKKWLGDEKMKCIILGVGTQKDQAMQTVIDFKFGKVFKIGIISYETLRKYFSDLRGYVDIVVADEGHRLKSVSGNKTIAALQGLSAGRKILLTGTPLQNNLSELFAMVDFVRPGSLGSTASFQNVFESPIEKGRDKNASEEAVLLGKSRLAELQRIVGSFILRRDASVNCAYLPKLSSFAIFCRPSDLQVSIIKTIISRRWKSDLEIANEEILSLLSELRKVCGHPDLLGVPPAFSGEANDGQSFQISPGDSKKSGKLIVLCALVDQIVNHTGERCVIVSQWTSMLNVIEAYVRDMGITFCRLDGSTSISKRQDIVNSFNKNNIGQVFLLSTAAGGVGLNLIGANRLILVDSHWNPALDNQAMARIWRDGQKKDCFIYRLLTTGTIEEKVYQRQMLKGELAHCVHDTTTATNTPGKSTKEWGSFTKEEIKELFDINIGTSCMTADQLGEEYQDEKQSSDTLLNVVRDPSRNVPITFVFKEKIRMIEKTVIPKDSICIENAHPAATDDLDTCDEF